MVTFVWRRPTLGKIKLFLVLSIAVAALAEPLFVTDIEFVVHPVFPEEKYDGFPWNTLNSVHINSREWLLRRLLPFRDGEQVDSMLIYDGERILRDEPYIGDAKVSLVRTGDTVAVRYDVYELWTTKLTMDFSFIVDRADYGAEVEEVNLLGTGTDIFAEAFHNESGDHIGTGIAFSPIFPYRSKLSGFYDRTKLHEAGVISLDKPYIDRTTHLAFHCKATFKNGKFDFWRCEYCDTVSLHEEAMQGFVSGGAGSFFASIAAERKRFRYYDNPDSVVSAIGVGATFFTRKFHPDSNVNRLGYVEDIETGLRGFAYLWERDAVSAGLSVSGVSPIAGYFAMSVGSVGDPLGRQWFYSARWYSPMLWRFRSFGAVDIRSIDDAHPFPYYSIGSDGRLRGYPVHYGTGRKLVAANMELRCYVPFELWTVHFVPVLFVDYERCDNILTTDNSAEDWKSGSSLGFGLLFGSSRSTTGNILRVDVGFPIDRQYPPGIIIKNGMPWSSVLSLAPVFYPFR